MTTPTVNTPTMIRPTMVSSRGSNSAPRIALHWTASLLAQREAEAGHEYGCVKSWMASPSGVTAAPPSTASTVRLVSTSSTSLSSSGRYSYWNPICAATSSQSTTASPVQIAVVGPVRERRAVGDPDDQLLRRRRRRGRLLAERHRSKGQQDQREKRNGRDASARRVLRRAAVDKREIPLCPLCASVVCLS